MFLFAGKVFGLQGAFSLRDEYVLNRIVATGTAVWAVTGSTTVGVYHLARCDGHQIVDKYTK